MLETWCGNFGNEYTERNKAMIDREQMWKRILLGLKYESILEVGANIGENLDAIDSLIKTRLIGLEPNNLARKQIRFETIDGTAQNIPLDNESVELVFTCGVLIHIPPHLLGKVCDEIHRVSSKYIVCIEYFSAEPEEIPYRGKSGMLWKRDFGKFWMDRHRLNLLDYGFFWKPATGLDNLTFWIFEKK